MFKITEKLLEKFSKIVNGSKAQIAFSWGSSVDGCNGHCTGSCGNNCYGHCSGYTK